MVTVMVNSGGKLKARIRANRVQLYYLIKMLSCCIKGERAGMEESAGK